MNRSQFLKAVSDRTGAHRRDVEHVWENALAVIQDAVKRGQAVSISGFGKFTQRVRKARAAGMARNPFTGEMVKVAARPKSALPRFSPAKRFKDYVGGTLRALPKPSTKPMSLSGSVGGAKKKTTAKKAAKKKATARKPAKKAARRR